MQEDRENIAMRLHSVAIHLLRRVRRGDQESMQLTPARASLLSILVFGGPHTIGQLAKAEQVAFATISKLVSGLEADGLLQRRADAADARVTTVVATARARRLLERGRARRIEYMMALLDELPADAWSTIDRAVTLVETALDSAHQQDSRV